MPILRTQDKDWNCGVFALEHLLQLHGKVVDIHVLEHLLKTTKEDGTSHDAIENYLEKSYIPFGFSYKSTITHLLNHLPCLVNYQYDEDGHYGVVVSHGKVYLNIYNPYNGKIEDMTFQEFEDSWHSKRYGNRWMLYLK